MMQQQNIQQQQQQHIHPHQLHHQSAAHVNTQAILSAGQAQYSPYHSNANQTIYNTIPASALVSTNNNQKQHYFTTKL